MILVVRTSNKLRTELQNVVLDQALGQQNSIAILYINQIHKIYQTLNWGYKGVIQQYKNKSTMYMNLID
jgi:hypothetical protein